MTEDERRKLWRQHREEFFAILKQWHAMGSPMPAPKLPAVPAECVGMMCGAKTRAGTPCKRRDIEINGRCKLHGGLSTGPTTPEGKKRAALNGLKPKRKRRTP